MQTLFLQVPPTGVGLVPGGPKKPRLPPMTRDSLMAFRKRCKRSIKRQEQTQWYALMQLLQDFPDTRMVQEKDHWTCRPSAPPAPDGTAEAFARKWSKVTVTIMIRDRLLIPVMVDEDGQPLTVRWHTHEDDEEW